jgi:hypothetical protein
VRITDGDGVQGLGEGTEMIFTDRFVGRAVGGNSSNDAKRRLLMIVIEDY